MSPDIIRVATGIGALMLGIAAYQWSTPEEMTRNRIYYRLAYALMFTRGLIFIVRDVFHLF